MSYIETGNYQPTWAGIIKMLFSAKHLPLPDRAARIKYQQKELGRSFADHAILEARTVPRKTATGSIDDVLRDYGLDTRALMERRDTTWRTLFTTYRPRAVVMYGSGYGDLFRRIAANFDAEFPVRGQFGLGSKDSGACRIISCRHPANGCKNDVYRAVGDLISDFVSL